MGKHNYSNVQKEITRLNSQGTKSFSFHTWSASHSFEDAFEGLTTGQLNTQVVQVDYPLVSTPNEDLDGYFQVSAYDVENSVSSIFLFDLNSITKEMGARYKKKLANLRTNSTVLKTSSKL